MREQMWNVSILTWVNLGIQHSSFTKVLHDDGQSGPKHVARLLTFKPSVLKVEIKLDKVPLKMEVNVRAKQMQQDYELHYKHIFSYVISELSSHH
jgi:hypothetical protein